MRLETESQDVVVAELEGFFLDTLPIEGSSPQPRYDKCRVNENTKIPGMTVQPILFDGSCCSAAPRNIVKCNSEVQVSGRIDG